MPDAIMPSDDHKSNVRFPAFETMQDARKALNIAWYRWLRTQPATRLVSEELGLTQGILEELVDQARAAKK